MKKTKKYLLASLFLFSLVPGCKERLFNNPFDPQKSDRGFDIESKFDIEQNLFPADMAFSGDALWISTGSSVLYSINFSSGIWIRYLDLEYGNINGICYDGENLWINLEGRSEIAKISIISGEIIKNLRFKTGNYRSMDFFDDYIYIADKNSNSIAVVNILSGAISRNIKVPVFSIDGFCTNGSDLWILEKETLSIYMTDMNGNRINDYKSPAEKPVSLACTNKYLWLGEGNGKIYRLRFR